MDDDVRFCDGADAAARRLMLAMRDERPPQGAANRALVALGVGGATLLTTSAAFGAASAGTALSKSITGIALKWLGAGAALGVAAATGATLLPPLAADPPVESAPAPVAADGRKHAPGARVDRSAAEPALLEPSADESDRDPAAKVLPTAPAPGMRAGGTAAREPVPAPAEAQSVARFEPPPGADTLEREIQLLDEARSAVRANAPGAALAKLDRFTREFPRGRLASEAFVVRLEALVRANRVAEARALATRHLNGNPKSPHAARIRRIVGLEAP
jgi:hypothetical protein